MSNEIAVLNKELVEREQVVLARNPDELNAAHSQMITWCDTRITAARDELKTLEGHLLHAQEHDWQEAPWKRQITRTKQRVVYYGKIRCALLEGYCIVPNFPIDVFAIKTKRKRPSSAVRSSKYSHGIHMPDIKSDQSPSGEGRYLDPATLNESWDETEKNDEDKDVTTYYSQATELGAPEFPFVLVKPEIIKDISFARTVKIFDELGVMPERRHRSGGDPMIIGRIKLNNNWSSRQMSFMLAWWMNPEEF